MPAPGASTVTVQLQCSPKIFETFGFVRTRHRKCRDLSCSACFLIFWIGYIVLGSFGLYYGRPSTFVYGVDYEGNICGTGSLSSQKYIVYPRTNQDLIWNLNTKSPLDYKFYGICTDTCPGNPDDIDFMCNYNVFDPRKDTQYSLGRNEILDCLSRTDQVARCRFIRSNCWYIPVETKPILFRCIPIYQANYTQTQTCIFPPTISDPDDPDCLVIRADTSKTVEEPAQPVLLFDQLNQLYYSWGRYVTDLVRGWWVIVLSAILLPALLSYIWLISMKKYTRGVFYTSIGLLVSIGVLFCVFLFAQAGQIQYDWISQYTLEKYAFMSNESTLYLAYGLSIFMGLLMLALFSLRRTISRAIDVLKLGSKALKNLPMTLVFPGWMVLLIIGLFVWAAFVSASLASAGETVIVDLRDVLNHLLARSNETLPERVIESIRNQSESINGTLTYYAGNTTLNWMQIYNWFMFLWSVSFAQGLVIMVVSSSIGMWYFSKNKSRQPNLRVHRMPTFYIMDSLFRTMFFHFGTVAIGSALIATLKLIRWIVAWFQAQIKATTAGPTFLPRNFRMALNCMIQCLLSWMQSLLQIVSHYSYIYAAIKGRSFADSGRMVFGLVIKYTGLMTSVSILCSTIIFFCKISISIAACFTYSMIVSNVDMFSMQGESPIFSPVASIILCFLLAYTICTAFFNVFDIAVDTILICYVTDIDENQLRHMGDPKFRFPAHVKATKFAFLPVQPIENVSQLTTA